jgi:hypothetical protein
MIRVTVAAKDAEEFLRTAAVRLRDEFFAPWDGPVAATVRFEMPFTGAVSVRGEATARAAVVGGRKGVMLRAVRLDPDSVQVPLADDGVPTPLDESWEDFDEPSETQRSKVPQKVAARMVDVSGRPRVPTRNITRRMPTLVPTKSADVAEFASSPVTRPNERLSASLAEELRKKETRSVPPPREKTPPPRPPPGGRERTPPPVPRARTEPPRPPPASTSETPHTHAAQPAPEPEVAPEVELTPEVELAPEVEPTPEPDAPRPARTEPVPEIPAEVRGRRMPLPTDPPTASRPRRASRRIWIAAAVVLAGAGAAAIALTRGGGEGAREEKAPRGDKTTSSPELERHLALADQRLAEGRLTGPGGDAALDHLVAARQLATDDPRVVSRLGALADTFEKLAAGALDAGDLGEAAAHLQAALIADPGRQRAADKLREIEARVRSDQRNR